MTLAEKHVRTIFPDAYCSSFKAPMGSSHCVIFNKERLPTWWFPTKKQAWAKAAEIISHEMMMKLEYVNQ